MGGDGDGHVRRALGHFPFQEPVQRVLHDYYIAEAETPSSPYRLPPMWSMNPPRGLVELTVIANFVEVFLAKEGHGNPVGVNLLEKLQMPTMPSLYGAMLAEVDFVIMGAGIPAQVPGILDELQHHGSTGYRLDVLGSEPEDKVRLEFDPRAVFPGVACRVGPLLRPRFLPIVSSVALAKTLVRRATGRIDGFVIEASGAGGHNAPPRGALRLNEEGEPLYGERDVVDLNRMRALGLPFWLAGGYDSEERLQQALEAGAAGIQVGTAFAYCDESGLDEALKNRVL